MKIRVVHPITHNGSEYSRGVHDLDDELAKLFLGLKDGYTGELLHVAVPFEEKSIEGEVKRAVDAPVKSEEPSVPESETLDPSESDSSESASSQTRTRRSRK